MFFRYWFKLGKAKVIKKVERIIYTPPVKIELRFDCGSGSQWVTLFEGKDFTHYILSKE